MEVLNLKRLSGVAKLVGIMVCIGGVSILAFYKGPHWRILSHHYIFGSHNNNNQLQQAQNDSWIKGCFIMLTSNTCWGLWLVLQSIVMKEYPSKLLFTTLQCLLSTIQSFGVAIALVRDPVQWQLGWNIRLLAVAYCGIVVTGITFYLQAWIIEKKGPVFLAMSTPLNLIFTMFCSTILLCEIISLGSILGGILLIVGLYSVLWAKNREQKMDEVEFCLPIVEAGGKVCTQVKTVET
ncbi:hypothetical protein ACFE04_022100 [Oxalis oulophora]